MSTATTSTLSASRPTAAKEAGARLRDRGCEASASSRRSANQVIALYHLNAPPSGSGVCLAGGCEVASQFEEVRPHGVPLLSIPQHRTHPLGLGEPRIGTGNVSDRDRPVEDSGWIVAIWFVAQGDELVVPLEDLAPVGLFRCRGVGVKRSDSRLDLIAAGALLGRARPEGSRHASAISAVSQRDRSCSSSGTNRPAESNRAGRRACWSIISASSPRASGSVVASVS